MYMYVAVYFFIFSFLSLYNDVAQFPKTCQAQQCNDLCQVSQIFSFLLGRSCDAYITKAPLFTFQREYIAVFVKFAVSTFFTPYVDICIALQVFSFYDFKHVMVMRVTLPFSTVRKNTVIHMLHQHRTNMNVPLFKFKVGWHLGLIPPSEDCALIYIKFFITETNLNTTRRTRFFSVHSILFKPQMLIQNQSSSVHLVLHSYVQRAPVHIAVYTFVKQVDFSDTSGFSWQKNKHYIFVCPSALFPTPWFVAVLSDAETNSQS